MIRNLHIKDIRQDTWAALLVVLSGLYLIIISWVSKGLYGDTDSITHFEIARYAFKYPRLLLSHWGKPLFTILSSPFAQFGLKGSILFNILCGLLTSWLIYKIARKFQYRYALAAIPFTLMAPIYMVNLFTSLTEILFALVLVAAIYFFLTKKFVWSAIIISFIPYARTEGIMFLPIFLACFLAVRNYKAIPFLGTGFILFSLAGYPQYKDFFWFFTAMPYSSAAEIYGSGSFWYYFERFHQLLGLPMSILGGIGLIYLILRLFKDKRPIFTTPWLTEYILIIGSLVAYVLAQSVLWCQGWMAVLASNRFMACIMPLGSFLAVVGLEILLSLTRKRAWLTTTLQALIFALVIFVPYTLHEIPARLAKGGELMKMTAGAFKHLDRHHKRIVYFDPKFTFYLNQDPYAYTEVHMGIPDNNRDDLGVLDSSYVVWDTHFSEFEQQLPLEKLLYNTSFRLIDGFMPSQEFRFFTGRYFMSYIFQKVPARSSKDEFQQLFMQDFEALQLQESQERLTDSVASSGSYSNKVNSKEQFSLSARMNLNEISTSSKVILQSRMKVLVPPGGEPGKMTMVLEIRDSTNEMYRYFAVPAEFFKPTINEWTDVSLTLPLATDYPPGGYIKVYLWYTGLGEVFVDDMEIRTLEVNSN